MNINFEEQLAVDMCGREIEVGDTVVSTIAACSRMYLCTVVRFTEKKVVVRPHCKKYDRLRDIDQVVKAVM